MRSTFPTRLYNSGSAGDSDPTVFNMTGSVQRVSRPFSTAGCIGFSVQAVYASLASPGASGVTGSLKLQCTNYPLEDSRWWLIPERNWTDVSGSARTLQASGSANYMDNFLDVNYANVRVVYTNTLGSGSMTIDVCGNRQP